MSLKIKLVRVDNRLLHATVALNWNSFVNANYIAVVDPSHVNDPFVQKVMQLCLPKKLQVKLFSNEQLLEFLNQEFIEDRNVIIIFKDLGALKGAVEIGLDVKEVQLPYPASGLLLKKMSDYFTTEDINCIRYVQENGIRFFFQTAPHDAKDYAFFKKKG